MLIQDLLETSAARKPGNTAVSGGAHSIDYRNLHGKSSYLADLLRKNGSKPGDNIALLLDKSIETIVAIFGILKSGAAYIPLDSDSPINRLHYILQDIGTRVIITNPKNQPAAEKIASGLKQVKQVKILFIDKLLKEYTGVPVLTPDPGIDENSTAYILYTSGSTGVPKGVKMSHGNALSFINWAHDYFRVNSKDVFSSHAPFHFDLSIFDLFVSIKAGAEICLIPRVLSSFPVSLADFIEKNRITIWYSIPGVLVNLVLNVKKFKTKLQSIKKLIYAGENFPVKYLKNIISHLAKTEFYNLYGPTETNVITYYKIRRNSRYLNSHIPIGYPCPYAEIKVLDQKGNKVKPGQKGELIVKSTSMMQGYVNNNKATAKVIKTLNFSTTKGEKYYFTGDMVKVLGDNFFQLAGRKDNMVKIKGFRVELEEIESVLIKHEQVKECLVRVNKDNDRGDNELEALVVPHREMEKRDIISFLKNRLPIYMIPRHIRFYPGFKKNNRGKIDRIFYNSA
jgi:amino acid adenylation domain-containing protein